MTNMKKMISLSGLVLTAALAACVSTKDAVQDITAPPLSAKIKFFNFAVAGPGVNFYANDLKMSAVSSATGAESVLGVNYGGVGAGGLYTGIAPGQYTVAGKIAAATDKDLAIATLPVTVVAGKAYSFYLSGLYNTTAKSSESFVVEDVLPTVSYSSAYVRFVNASYNASPMILYATSTVLAAETAIGTAVAYKTGGTFVAVPEAVYDLNLRTTGSTTNLVTGTAVSFLAGHIYTVAVRGDMVSTVTANKPALANTANY